MNLPINGRIAILDDQIEQALPIIEALSKHQCPVSYYSGELESLPEEGENSNDLRVLFLDLILGGKGEVSNKILIGNLVPVLKRIISENNFPYIVIYWSRHSDTKNELVEEKVFKEGLRDRQPIGFVSAKKSEYFDLDGNRLDDFDEKIKELFSNVNETLASHFAFQSLIEWENTIHKSVDSTLQNTFQPIHGHSNWSNEANNLLTSLGQSVAGKHYRGMDAKGKMINNYTGLNHLLEDELEEKTNTIPDEQNELLVDRKTLTGNDKYALNKKLLFSTVLNPLEYPGALLKSNDPDHVSTFKEILHESLYSGIKEEVTKDFSQSLSGPIHDMEKSERNAFDKKVKVRISSLKAPFFEKMEKVILIVTPLCDFVQKKQKNSRALKGMILPKECRAYLPSSDALYTSPPFRHKDSECVLLLDLKHFFTQENGFLPADYKYLMRVRKLMLTDIQSKLARHITRTGLLYLE